MTHGADPPPVDLTNAVTGDVYGGLVQAGTIEGGIHHYYGERLHVIEEFPEVRAPAVRWLMDQPSRLLDARSQVVPFYGRKVELSWLQEWRDSSRTRLSVLLLHGPGGQGKSRLAAEFAARSRSEELPASQRWRVLQAGLTSATTHSSGTGAPATEGDGAGVLLIVDYADRWAHSELERLLSAPILHQRSSARILLIGRTVRWYAAVRGELTERQAAASDLPLSPLAADRLAMFGAARDRYSEPDLYDVADAASIQPPGSLEHPDFGLTLTLHMAALVAVDAHTRGQRPPTEPHALSAYLLDREYRAWQRLYDAGSLGQDYKTRPRTMAQAVFTAAVTGAVGHHTATQALRALDLPGHPQELLHDHRFCYPPDNRELALQPLYPDRLAEDFLALLTPGHDVSAYDPDPWATTAPAVLLAADCELRPMIVSRAVTVLASAASRWPHLGEKTLYPLLRADPNLAMEAGSAALTTIADIGELPDDILEPIWRILPPGQRVDLDDGAAAITGAFTARRLSITKDPASRAEYHFFYSNRLAATGRYTAALEHSQEALSLRISLVQADPAAHRLSLAQSMGNHAVWLRLAGQPEEAMTYSQEAIEHYRELAEDNRARYLAVLAQSIGNHAVALAEAGRQEEALEHSKQAIEHYRELAATDRARHLPILAGSLVNHARWLAKDGRLDEALEFSQSAVEHYRELAAVDRIAHIIGLTIAVSSHAVMLMKTGRLDEALEHSQLTVEHYRELAEINRTWLPRLAQSMSSHATNLVEAGRQLESLIYSQGAVEYYSELAAANRGAWLLDLAKSVHTHAVALAMAGRQPESLTYSQRAISCFGELAAADDAATQSSLAELANTHTVALAEAGRLAEAVAYSQQSVEHYRRLAEADRSRWLPELANSMNSHAVALARAGRLAEAVDHSQHAVELLEVLAAADRTTHLPDLAALADLHAKRLTSARRRPESLAYSQRAVEYYTELAAADRATYLLGLAESVGNHAVALADVGRPEALAYSQRAADHFSELAAADRATHLSDLAKSLWAFASIRVQLHANLDEAALAGAQAMDLFQHLAEVDSAEYTGYVRASASTVANALDAAGHVDKASQLRRALAREPSQPD